MKELHEYGYSRVKRLYKYRCFRMKKLYGYAYPNMKKLDKNIENRQNLEILVIADK